MHGLSQLATVSDDNLLLGAAAAVTHALDGLDHVHALGHLAEHLRSMKKPQGCASILECVESCAAPKY